MKPSPAPSSVDQFPALQPWDTCNQQLAEQVHPPGWSNPVPQHPYQLVVIGAGTAGLVTAAGAAGLGARVALIERELMGGDCLNIGCVPSKAILQAARVAAAVRGAEEYGVQVSGQTEFDFAAAMQRMRRLRAKISPHDSAQRFTELGVDVFFGQGVFTDENTICVTQTTGQTSQLKFRKAVIASGARAATPAIPGLDQIAFLTNETVFSLTELPRRFGIIGAGPIGCELAQAFARFGSEVTLVDRGSRLLPREDPQAAEVLRQQFQHEGIRLILNAQDLQLAPSATGEITIRVADNENATEVSVDHLLLAVGRTPNVEHLNLDAVGVAYDHSGVHVNDYLQTNNSRIYAAGDVCSQYKFTHAADFQARIVIQNALFALGPVGRRKASQLRIPWATYTSPEVAQVGLTEESARQQGLAIDTYIQPLSEVDRAILEGQDQGFVKVHTRQGSDRIVGATIVAENAGDLISEITLAMNSNQGLSKIGSTIHPYPTRADAIRKLGDQFSRTKLTPSSKRFLSWLMRCNVGR